MSAVFSSLRYSAAGRGLLRSSLSGLCLAGLLLSAALLYWSSAAAAVPTAAVRAAGQRGDDEISAKPSREDVEAFMARKLKAAQLALEGVMTNKFQQVQDNADLLVDLSRHAAWKQLASPSYIQDTADFVAAAEYLNRTAAAEDAEGAILAFNRVTACCANCHQHVRTPRVAQRILPSGQAAVAGLQP